jgi:hypothetical protein
MKGSARLTESQTAPGKGFVTGLCMECAMRHHDYREMLRHETGDDHFSETPLPHAWIDGRRHMLLPAIGTEGITCSECNGSVPSIYMPMK